MPPIRLMPTLLAGVILVLASAAQPATSSPTTFAQVETSHSPADDGGSAAIAGLPDFVKIYPGAQVFHNAKDDTGWGINYRSNASVAELTHFYKDLEQRSNVPLRTETEFGMNFGDKASPGTLMVLISDKGEWRSVGLYFTLKRTNGL
jgi:hypothetical protein